MSRLAKTQLVSKWPVAFQRIRGCNKIQEYRPLTFNCCRCEKCVRTMLALVSLGILHETKAFQVDDVTPDLVMQHVRIHAMNFPWYNELISPLEARGREDLAQVIKDKISIFVHRQDKQSKGIKRWKQGISRWK